MKTFEELVEGIKELKKRGFIKTHRSGNTGIGKTLEDDMLQHSETLRLFHCH